METLRELCVNNGAPRNVYFRYLQIKQTVDVKKNCEWFQCEEVNVLYFILRIWYLDRKI